jgi:hypothetical protein
MHEMCDIDYLRRDTSPLFRAPSSVLSTKASSIGANSITTLAIHPLHDAHIVYAIDGQIQFILELERLFDIRYYSPSETMTLAEFEGIPFLSLSLSLLRRCMDLSFRWLLLSTDRWAYIFDFIRPLTGEVDHVIITRDRWRWDEDWPRIATKMQRKSIIPKLGSELHHHRAHSIGSFYDSSFQVIHSSLHWCCRRV